MSHPELGRRCKVRQVSTSCCQSHLRDDLDTQSLGLPCLIVTGRCRTFGRRQNTACRPVRLRRPRHIGTMRLLPLTWLIVFLVRKCVDSMMKPSMPIRGYPGRINQSVVDHPTAFIRLIAVILVAGLIFTNQFTVAPRVETRTKGLSVPPSKELQQKFHQSRSAFWIHPSLRDYGVWQSRRPPHIPSLSRHNTGFLHDNDHL